MYKVIVLFTCVGSVIAQFAQPYPVQQAAGNIPGIPAPWSINTGNNGNLQHKDSFKFFWLAYAYDRDVS